MRTAGIHGISAAFLEFRQAEFSTFVERHVESVLYFLWKRVRSGESCAVFCSLCRDRLCRVRCFYSKKNSVENVPPERFQNQNTASGTQGRSGLVRSALEKLFSIFVLGNKSDTARRVPTRLPNESNDLVSLCSCASRIHQKSLGVFCIEPISNRTPAALAALPCAHRL